LDKKKNLKSFEKNIDRRQTAGDAAKALIESDLKKASILKESNRAGRLKAERPNGKEDTICKKETQQGRVEEAGTPQKPP